MEHIVRITAKSVAFAVSMDGGFGQIVVELEPGECKTVMVNGRLVTVIREYVH